MELPANQFKRGMKAGKPQIGLWSSLSSHYSVEVIAGSGFDWLLLDTEHSPNDLENVVTQLQAAAAYPTTSIVRPAWNDMVLIKQYLEMKKMMKMFKGGKGFRMPKGLPTSQWPGGKGGTAIPCTKGK